MPYKPQWPEFGKTVRTIAERENRQPGDVAEEFVAAIRDGRIRLRTASGEPPPTNWHWMAEFFRRHHYWTQNLLVNQDDIDECFPRPKVFRDVPSSHKENEFVEWMKAEREKHGTYPPRQPPKSTFDRPTYRNWAKENFVTRARAETWIRKHKLSEPPGAPKKNSSQ
jgi:hypothetical protein